MGTEPYFRIDSLPGYSFQSVLSSGKLLYMKNDDGLLYKILRPFLAFYYKIQRFVWL